MRLLVAVATILASMIVGVTRCDPGEEGPGEHVTVRIGNGTVLGKHNYGLWRPGDDATTACRWVVLRHGKAIAHGGQHDAVISGTGTKGGTLNANHCGWFYK